MNEVTIVTISGQASSEIYYLYVLAGIVITHSFIFMDQFMQKVNLMLLL